MEDGATQTRSVREEFKARLREVREQFKDVPDRYKGYELLLDIQDDPHIKIPTSETIVVYSVSVKCFLELAGGQYIQIDAVGNWT